MQPLTRDCLMSLETYSDKRNEFRASVMAHKKTRHVGIGPNATLYFEDRNTVQYQIQEMLRIEKIFEADSIQEELDTYNPMIPTGSNWKATFMLEYADPDERKEMLGKLIGVEKAIWVKVDDLDRVNPIANEDLDRETEDKTSSVHFLRFELSDEMVKAAKNGASISMGIAHENYDFTIDELPASISMSLISDLD
jgi:uncharacterized protein DUF3501